MSSCPECGELAGVPSRWPCRHASHDARAAIVELARRPAVEAGGYVWAVVRVLEDGRRVVVAIAPSGIDAHRELDKCQKRRPELAFASVYRFNGYQLGDSWQGPGPLETP